MPGALTSPQKPTTRPTLAPNVNNVVLGNLDIKTWYPSFYPKELIGSEKLERLYVCQWCFRYTPELMKFCQHRKACAAQDEPATGDMIYEKDSYAIHEVDGEEHKLFSQNLSLFAKLFLDTKSVFFDVSSFLYYTLVHHGQVIGFFSKEKMSWDNNNVACILVFPPWQKKGLGQILMGVSYVLGRREGRLGGPERPLSAPGQRGYLNFWCGEVCRHILQAPNKRVLSIKAISEATWLLQEDIVTALRAMDICEGRKTAAGNVLINKSKVRAWVEKNHVSLESPVDETLFITAADSLYESGSES